MGDRYTGLDFSLASFVDDAFDEETMKQYSVRKPHVTSLRSLHAALIGGAPM